MGELLAIGSAVAWAFTSIAMRPIVGRALWRSSVLRMVICTAMLTMYAWPTGALTRAAAAPTEAWLWLLGSTISSIVIGDSLYFMAAGRIGVARALPIASSFPLLTTAGAVLLLHEPPTLALLAGSALVVLAVALIGGERAHGNGRNDVVGLLLAGLAACMWATSGLFLGPALRLVDPTAANTLRFGLATVLFSVYLVTARPAEHFDRRLAWLSVAAAIGTLCSSWLFLGGIAAAGVARGVALNATSPVFSAILAAVVLRERVSRRTALGIASSVFGTILLVV
ncbi:MAG TPA: DMT family transporter [Chloroflexota bacterium]|jgi:drug/metabolite transporter (DMT)-like permease|nr:DMT family transporter [Chloroflexota bacterium]